VLAAGVNNFQWVFQSWASQTTFGTAVTPGASSAEGSWTEIISDVDVDYDVYEILLGVGSGNTTGQVKNHFVDIGIDPTGGTSYTAIIENINCGQSVSLGNGGIWFRFPIRIPAGSSIAVRIQGSNLSAGTVRIAMGIYGLPTRPELVRAGQFAEAIGAGAGTTGTTFTPGASAAYGSWVSLGTTTRDLWWWQIGVGWNDSATSSATYNVDLAYGDASGKINIITGSVWTLPGTAEIVGHSVDVLGYCEVPAGSTLYVRGKCTGASPEDAHAVAIGIGG
jgi:hypothetical protein